MMDFQLLREAEVRIKSDNEEKTKRKRLLFIIFKNVVSPDMTTVLKIT